MHNLWVPQHPQPKSAFPFITSFGLRGLSLSRGLGAEDKAREEGGKEPLDELGMILVGLIRVEEARTDTGDGFGFCYIRLKGDLLRDGQNQ